jgi:hypothetical protein
VREIEKSRSPAASEARMMPVAPSRREEKAPAIFKKDRRPETPAEGELSRPLPVQADIAIAPDLVSLNNKEASMRRSPRQPRNSGENKEKKALTPAPAALPPTPASVLAPQSARRRTVPSGRNRTVAETAPTINVTIGRIEVRAVPAPPPRPPVVRKASRQAPAQPSAMSLDELLQEHIVDDVPGSVVTSARPDSNGNNMPTTGINLYLYQVTPNAHWRNHDVPTRDSSGRLVRRPRIALDLHYLLTFYGDETQWIPQRVLGSAVRVLHSQPQLRDQNIDDAINANPSLALSDLAAETEVVKFTPLALTLEELSKLWSVFFQVPYTLSLAYEATVVFIEGRAAPRATLPVQQRNIYVRPFRQPEIREVLNQAGANEPLVSGSTLLIRGQRLQGEDTQLRVAGEDAVPESVNDREITVSLTEPPFSAGTLRAGVQGVQVVQRLMMGTPPMPHKGVESNIMPFVIHPTIDAVAVDVLDVDANDLARANITIDVTPGIGPKQRVVLLLNENVVENAAAYRFEAPPRDSAVDQVTIPVRNVRTGSYLLRLQVDGAENLLTVSDDPEAPLLEGPQVVIP